ncbi:MAG: creatininase family protein [Candidatus Heimdallarchaeaceae archaeon]
MDEQDRNKSATFTSIQLENLSWIEAEDMLKNYEVVLLALGARTKEHGPHLPLNNDFLMAEYLKEKVIKKVPVAVLPTLQYGYYPSFLEYPGSVSLKEETFKQVVIDICKSMNGYGIKKFYIINTGISTLKPLKSAAAELEQQGIILRLLNLLEVEKKHDPELLQQEGGTHADEGETSIMLHMYPEVVDMNKAVKDYDSRPDRRGLTRDPNGDGVYSPTGIWGDPTLATEEKGKILTDALVEEIINQVTNLIDL